jgi:hypothetical protein
MILGQFTETLADEFYQTQNDGTDKGKRGKATGLRAGQGETMAPKRVGTLEENMRLTALGGFRNSKLNPIVWLLKTCFLGYPFLASDMVNF